MFESSYYERLRDISLELGVPSFHAIDDGTVYICSSIYERVLCQI